MIQFQENAWTDGRMDRRMEGLDGRMDMPYFIGPFQLTPVEEKLVTAEKKTESEYCLNPNNLDCKNQSHGS